MNPASTLNLSMPGFRLSFPQFYPLRIKPYIGGTMNLSIIKPSLVGAYIVRVLFTNPSTMSSGPGRAKQREHFVSVELYFPSVSVNTNTRGTYRRCPAVE